jgi:hypothetical protein
VSKLNNTKYHVCFVDTFNPDATDRVGMVYCMAMNMFTVHSETCTAGLPL